MVQWVVLYDQQTVGRGFETSLTPYFIFASMRAGDIMKDYGSLLLSTAGERGE